METKGRVAAAVLPEFELDDSQMAIRKAYAVLDFLYKGMPKEDTLKAFGVTYEEVIPYEEQWARKRNHQLIH